MFKVMIAKLVLPLAAIAMIVGAGVNWLSGVRTQARAVVPVNPVISDSAPIRLVGDQPIRLADDQPAKKPADLTNDDLVGTWASHTDLAAGPVHIIIDGINILKPDNSTVSTATILIQIGDPINKNMRIIIEGRGVYKMDAGNLKTTTDTYNAHAFNDSDDETIKSNPQFAQFLAKPPEKKTTVDTISDWTGNTFTLTTTDSTKPNDPPMVTHCVRIAK